MALGKHFAAAAAVGAISMALGSCEERNAYKPPPPVEVTVAKPISGQLEDALQTDGVVASTQFVEIRAQVEGRVTGIHFKDGQKVKAGDLLFTIDPRSYQAAASSASAEASSLKAQLDYAKSSLGRTRGLYERGSVSLEDYDAARQKVASLKAQLAAASAGAEGARVTLGFSKVRSPIAGTMSRRMVDKGQLVGANEPTLLATVVSNDATYVEFSISQNELLWFRRYLAAHPDVAETVKREGLTVRASLPGDEGFPHVGQFQSRENMLGRTSGTLKARAIFANEDGKLIPGLFCKVEIPVGKSEGLLVPETATALDQVGRYVLVVNDKDTVERRNVVLGAKKSGFVRIEEGLTADDRVIVKGMVRVRMGSHVKPIEEPLTPPKQAAQPAKSAPAVEPKVPEDPPADGKAAETTKQAAP